MRALLLSLMLSLMAGPTLAVLPNEILKDPALEERARDISKGLRCLVCQNQSIDESDATLARDLRVLVRERLVAGDSNKKVMDYVVSRYGDFVLLNPPFKTGTLVLWIGPFVFLLIGLIALGAMFRKRKQVVAGAGAQAGISALSADEENRLNALLKDDDA
jgi:cytochrome c-type biogenesis protein CcmH